MDPNLWNFGNSELNFEDKGSNWNLDRKPKILTIKLI